MNLTVVNRTKRNTSVSTVIPIGIEVLCGLNEPVNIIEQLLLFRERNFGSREHHLPLGLVALNGVPKDQREFFILWRDNLFEYLEELALKEILGPNNLTDLSSMPPYASKKWAVHASADCDRFCHV